MSTPQDPPVELPPELRYMVSAPQHPLVPPPSAPPNPSLLQELLSCAESVYEQIQR